MLRERFGIYADATCPAGTTLIDKAAFRDSTAVCRKNDQSGFLPAVCPSGQTTYFVANSAREVGVVCIPSSATTYTPDFSKPRGNWLCQSSQDYIGTTWSRAEPPEDYSSVKCIRVSATAPSSGDTSLDGLSTQYTSLKTQYSTLAAEVLADPSKMTARLPTLQSLNQQIASVLDQMLRAMQYAKQSPNSDAYRDQLVETLGRIQTDYNGLKTNTDTLETLRRIRGAQDESWRGPLFVYLMAFLAAAIFLVLVILFRRQTSESTIAPTMSPTAMPPLT